MRGPNNLFELLPALSFFSSDQVCLVVYLWSYTHESYWHLYTINLKNQAVQSVKTGISLCKLLPEFQNNVCRKLIFAPETNSNRLISHINFISDRYAYHIRIVAIS